jgi:hypothetical protein
MIFNEQNTIEQYVISKLTGYKFDEIVGVLLMSNVSVDLRLRPIVRTLGSNFGIDSKTNLLQLRNQTPPC